MTFLDIENRSYLRIDRRRVYVGASLERRTRLSTLSQRSQRKMYFHGGENESLQFGLCRKVLPCSLILLDVARHEQQARNLQSTIESRPQVEWRSDSLRDL